jgi:uncharacterized membrane protein
MKWLTNDLGLPPKVRVALYVGVGALIVSDGVWRLFTEPAFGAGEVLFGAMAVYYGILLYRQSKNPLNGK